MFKLAVVSGPNRGSSFSLNDGECRIGRHTANAIVLNSGKVSKQHCVIKVHGNDITVEDLGSSNGTFVNGTLIRSRKIKVGDRVSVGEFVLELAEASHRVAALPPPLSGFGDLMSVPKPGGLMTGAGASGQGMGLPGIGQVMVNANEPPKDLKGKVLWYFENHLMPVFYGFNLKNEWRYICLSLFLAFMVGNLVISVYPLMESNRASLVKETKKRASFMARQIADSNSALLAAKQETKTDVGMIENAEGVRVAVLTDLDSRILAPGSKFNQYLSSGIEATLAVKFKADPEKGMAVQADETTVVAIEPVRVLNPALGRNVTVAMAIVSIDTSLSTPDVGEMGIVYSETLILTGILGGIILMILYRLTLKPFEVLNEDMDKALKGELSQVTHEYKIEEMNPLWEIINSAIQRIPRTGANSMGGMEEDRQSFTEEVNGPIRAIGNVAPFGIVIFDYSAKIYYMNSIFEEITGIRLENAAGQELHMVARDQALGAFASDIFGRVPVGTEGVTEDFDFSGVTYRITVAAFGAPGGLVKGYLLIALKSNEG